MKFRWKVRTVLDGSSTSNFPCMIPRWTARIGRLPFQREKRDFLPLSPSLAFSLVLPIRIDECKHRGEFLREIFAALHHPACWQQICFALCHPPREKCSRYIRVLARACQGKNRIYSRREWLPSGSTDSCSFLARVFLSNGNGIAAENLAVARRPLCAPCVHE